MKKTLGFIIMGCVALTVLGLAPAAAQQPDKAVATVNGEKIGEKVFMDTLQGRYGDRVLNALIAGLVIQQAARAAGVTVTKDELDRRYVATERVVEMRAPFTGQNFELWLATKGLTRDYFRMELYQQMLLEKMVEKQVKVTDQDVSGFYQANKEQLREPAMMRLAHICVQTQKEAEQIRADLTAKKIEWNEAAKKYSLDPWTKDNGGDLDFMPKAGTPFHEAAFALRSNGDISQPVQTPMGFHLIKRLAYKEARTPPYEELEATIRQRLEHDQLQRLAMQKRDEILKAAKVERLIQLNPEPAPPAAAATAPAPH